LGLLINQDKSDLVPRQQFVYLGALYNLIKFVVSMSEENVSKLRELVRTFLSKPSQPAQTWLQVLGFLVSQEKFTRFGRLRLRAVQWELRRQWSQATGSLTDLVPITPVTTAALHWWLDLAASGAGAPISAPPATLSIHTDASTVGWGAHSDTREFHGIWSEADSSLHINVLELRAVRLALQKFSPAPGTVVLVSTDNTTVMAHVNKQGGLRSWALYQETVELFRLVESSNLFISAKHVPGRLNVLADQLSRRHQVAHTEWTLHKNIVDLVFSRWGKPNVDLFATRHNNQCPVFVSPVEDPLAWETDALSISWSGLQAYAFPPPVILPQVLLKVSQSRGLRLILIAPHWPKHAWFHQLLSIVKEPPLPLPCWLKMLRQPRTYVFHPSPHLFQLHGWLLVSKP